MSDTQYNGKALAASALLATGGCVLDGILCTASGSGIISIYDGLTTGGTKIVDALTMVAGTYYPLHLGLAAGCYIELVSGTGKFTAFWK